MLPIFVCEVLEWLAIPESGEQVPRISFIRQFCFAAALLLVVGLTGVNARGMGEPQGAGLLTADRVTVERSSQLPGKGSRTVYGLSEGHDHGELIVDRMEDKRLKPELRFNVWAGDVHSFRDDPALPLERRLAFFRPLMKRFLETEKPDPAYGLLFYGYSRLYERLPELAAKDSGWNRTKGQPVSKQPGYGYLESLLTRGGAYRELAETMAGFHYRVGIAGGLEELRVLPVSKLNEGQRAHLPVDVKANDLLPARIAIDFRLTADQ